MDVQPDQINNKNRIAGAVGKEQSGSINIQGRKIVANVIAE